MKIDSSVKSLKLYEFDRYNWMYMDTDFKFVVLHIKDCAILKVQMLVIKYQNKFLSYFLIQLPIQSGYSTVSSQAGHFYFFSP